MGTTKRVAAKEAEVEQVTTGKLMEDLKAVVADAEELLKATADQTGERIPWHKPIWHLSTRAIAKS